MSPVFIESIALAAPGLENWLDGVAILRDEKPYVSSPLSTFTPTLLPANEQRRATATVRLAFRVAEEAIRHGDCAANAVATVFASSDADMTVSHRLCSALAQTQRMVSPTDFHNSVHNAPSGYWHIGASSRMPSSAIAGYDYSFAAGLLEAWTQVKVESQTTLLVCYDVPSPEPLLAKRPLTNSFAVAILLAPEQSEKSSAILTIDDLQSTADDSTLMDDNLESLRLSNPAGRSLPLLQVLALRSEKQLHLRRSAERSMKIHITPLKK